jgi:HEXXH motif-containing protein
MTGFSAFALWDTAAQKARRARFMKLALLSEWGQDKSADDSILSTLLPALTALPYPAIFADNNTFFWSAVDNCARLLQSGALPAEAEQRLATLLFDAFFHQLPNSLGLPLKAGGEQVIALPELKVRSGGGLDGIQKQSPDMVLLSGAVYTAIKIAAPLPEFRLRMRQIDGEAESTLLLDSGTNLFSPSYGRLVIPNLKDEAGVALAGTIAEALAFLAGLDAEFAARIGRTINWYIPVRSDDPQMHISFSVAKLAGVIFLSQPTPEMGVPGWFKIAEVLAHEFAHNELNLYQESQPVFRDNAEQRFYSPWRTDPRPLNGLFHGIYSFWHVAEFFRCTLQSRALPDYQASVEQSYQHRLEQLRIALRQIPLEQLTPQGREIINVISKGVDAQTTKGDRHSKVGAADLEAHISQWRARNPNYAGSIRLER